MSINTLAQLAAVAALPPLRAGSPALLWLTHLVAKTTASIGVLDFIDNGGVALVRPSPALDPGASYLGARSLTAA